MMQSCVRHVTLARSWIFNSQTGSLGIGYRSYASGFNPLGWVKETVTPQIKEKQTKEEIEAAKRQAAEQGTRSVFDIQPAAVITERRANGAAQLGAMKRTKAQPKEHKYSTATFKISHRKLNMLGRQISGKPIDWAILQMQFSEKRASTRIMNMLATAKDHAFRYKHLDRSKLVVSEAWVGKGQRLPPRMEPRGRGRYGIRHHPNSKLTVVLREGKSAEQKKEERRKKILGRIVSASVTREDVPLRNPAPRWCW